MLDCVETGWVNQLPPTRRHRQPARLAPGPDLDLSGPGLRRASGASAPAVIVNLAGLKGVPTELYDAAKIDGAGWWGQLRNVTLPMMSPVIFYSLILGVVEVLQYFLVPFVLKNGTGEPGGSTLFFNLYIYKSFFTFQRMSYGATLAWLLFVDHAGRSRSSSLPARAAGSTTPGSGRRGDLGHAAGAGALPAIARGRSLRGRAKRPAQSFLLTFVAVALLAAFLSPLLQSASLSLKIARPGHAARCAALSGRSRDVRLQRAGRSTSTRCRSTGRSATLALVQPGRTSSQFVDPADPDAGADHVAGLVARAEPRPGSSRRTWRTTARSGTCSSIPRLLFNTVAARRRRHDRALVSCTLVAYGFARFRFPGRNLLFMLLISTHLPAGDRDDHPDLRRRGSCSA